MLNYLETGEKAKLPAVEQGEGILPQCRFTSVYDLEKPGGRYCISLRFPSTGSVYGCKTILSSLLKTNIDQKTVLAVTNIAVESTN
jgi:hypothetical protein